MDYDLELDKVAEEVKKLDKNRVKVCLQFPDGLKANATEAVKELEKKTAGKASFYIWSGSNFGGCDVPIHLERLGFDIIVGFGHCVFRK